MRSGDRASDRLSSSVIRYEAGYRSAADALTHAHSLRPLLAVAAPDCLVLSHYDAAIPTLRMGGFTGPLIVVEHGGIILNPRAVGRRMYWTQVLSRRLFSASMAAEVCVSRFMYGVQARLPHAHRLVIVRNGVDTARFAPVDGRIHGWLQVRRRRCDWALWAPRTREKGFEILLHAAGALLLMGRRATRKSCRPRAGPTPSRATCGHPRYRRSHSL